MVSSLDEIDRYKSEVWYSIDLFGERTAIQLGRLVERVLSNVDSSARNALECIRTFLARNLGESVRVSDFVSDSDNGYLLARVVNTDGLELTVGLGQYRELRRTLI